jgi:hypothetical protein
MGPGACVGCGALVRITRTKSARMEQAVRCAYTIKLQTQGVSAGLPSCCTFPRLEARRFGRDDFDL